MKRKKLVTHFLITNVLLLEQYLLKKLLDTV